MRIPVMLPADAVQERAPALGYGGGGCSFLLALLFCLVAQPPALEAAQLTGRLLSSEGSPVVGAMLTIRRGTPIHDVTVFSDAEGRFESPPLAAGGPYRVRVRRIGWQEGWVAEIEELAADERRELNWVVERERDPERLAAQLPANRWLELLVERIESKEQREEFLRQCTYCHQQGSQATRRLRDDAEWKKVLSLMARMGGTLSPELRSQIPSLFREAYEPKHAVPRLTAQMDSPNFAPPPEALVRRAVVDEWELGLRNSMQHDLVVHPDGRIYSVDMMQDQLFRLDPSVPGGARAAFALPRGDHPLGGVFGGGPNPPTPPNANSHVGPHSLQVAPDGSVWTTLALGNEIARFDVVTEEWKVYPLDEGYYPHTLRFDARGRVWYTVAGSNHVGRLDPQTGEHLWVRLPARTFAMALASRLMPVALWLNRNFDFSEAMEDAGGELPPVPYGIDVAPDGGVWFSQLNDNRIGRIDPDSLEVELIDTPFSAPRRLRFDGEGRLWIPGFSSGVLSRFDPATRDFVTVEVPTRPLGTETPYALNVDRERGFVWVCGTNSDSLIRFDPAALDTKDPQAGFRVYPLPTRVTYTREIDFDDEGRVWTSNSNLPAWQIEGGFPRVLRLDPREPAESKTPRAASKSHSNSQRMASE